MRQHGEHQCQEWLRSAFLTLSATLLWISGCAGCVQQPPVREDQPTSSATSASDEPIPAEANDQEQSPRVAPRVDRESPPAPQTAETAGAALQRARRLHDESRRKSARGDHAAAFMDATSAWQVLQQHADDPTCHALSEEIGRDINQLAKQANRAAGDSATDGRRTLILE